jgi:hypothetical protein
MNIEAFLASLPIMLYGMLGIFIVTAVIIGVIKLLSYIGNEK